MIRAFEPSFVMQYQTAFTELVRLGSVAAQKKVNGRDTLKEDSIAQRMFIVLQALDSDGLSTKQVEALEYCLLRLNESLSGPTVEALVNVSVTAEPVEYQMRTWGGLFNLSGQDVSFVHGISQSLDPEFASFSLSGQDVAFTHGIHYTLTADYGSFSLSGQDVAFTHTLAPYVVEAELFETVGNPQWRAHFESLSPADTESCDVTGNGDVETKALASGDDVIVTVYKLSNSGIAEDNGTVSFYKNGILSGAPASFFNLDNLDGTGANYKQRTITGLSPGDEVKVEVSEG